MKTLIKVSIEMLEMRELSISQGTKRAKETLMEDFVKKMERCNVDCFT